MHANKHYVTDNDKLTMSAVRRQSKLTNHCVCI